MSLEDFLARGRTAFGALMVDACTIQRQAGEDTDEFGNIIPSWIHLYSGKCRVQQPVAQAAEELAGQARSLMVRLELQLPMSVVGIEPEDQVLITASVSDPDLPGRIFIVRDLAHGTHKTARRIGVVERTS